MATFYDLGDGESLPETIRIKKGDLVSFNSGGGHVITGQHVLELIGPFIPGVLSRHGYESLSPEGAPGIIFFLARQPGEARIDIITGDPFFNPVTNYLEIIVT